MLSKIKESLKALKEICELLLGLLAVVRRHPGFFATVAALASAYSGLYWYANYYPGLTVESYFEALGNRKFEPAWDVLSAQYRDPRWVSRRKFEEAYATSVPQEKLKVSPRETSYLILPILFSRALRFEAEYELTERFTKEDIDKPEQHINSLWLQIHHRRDYERLIRGELGDVQGANPSLALRRYFKITVVIRRKPDSETGMSSFFNFPSRWEIQYMNFTEQGLKPLQGFN